MTEDQYMLLAGHAYRAHIRALLATVTRAPGLTPIGAPTFERLSPERRTAWIESVKAVLHHAPFVAAGKEMPSC